jgi:hypothetical protein
VNVVAIAALGVPIANALGTKEIYQALSRGEWDRIPNLADANPGDVVISPSGGLSGDLAKVGHVGIAVANKAICSNSSRHGKWEQNYTLASWGRQFEELGVAVFRHQR